MDTNGTRFHLLTGEGDWRPLADGTVGLAWDPEHAVVTLRPEIPRFRRRAAEEPPRRDQRRGAAADRWGTRYWIDDASRRILYQPRGEAATGVLWPTPSGCEPEGEADFRPLPAAAPAREAALAGLAVTRGQYLVAGFVAEASPAGTKGGLLVFDLLGGGPPLRLEWPAGVAFAPFDLAPAPDGGFWVLDRPDGDDPAALARLWRFDRRFHPRPLGGERELEPPREADFHPEGGAAEASGGRRYPLGALVPPADADASPPLPSDAVAVVGLPDGSALVLASAAGLSHSTLHRFRDGAWEEPVSLAGLLDPPETDLRAHDLAFVPARDGSRHRPAGDLYLADAGGNQTFVFRATVGEEGLELVGSPRYLPMRRFTGKGLLENPASDTGGMEVEYDSGDRWLPLVEQPRRRFVAGATLDGLAFDGKEPGCRWHRVLLDACIPDGAGVEVESRTGETRAELAQAVWRAEPAPYLRGGGSELPFHRPFGSGGRAVPGAGTWELLLQEAIGRYLELRLTLHGDRRSTPRLRALRVYYPRFSYLREYLPAVYREDRASASLLDRWLANPEGLLTALEGRIERVESLFDTRTAPPEYLDWLAGWLGAVLDPSWDDARRRLFLGHAELLFRWRGTVPGLTAALRLAIDPCPDESIFAALAADGREAETPCGAARSGTVRIVERFLLRSFPGVALGDPEADVAPDLASRQEAWSAAQGAEELHLRFREFQGTETPDAPDFRPSRLSPVVPEDAAEAATWRDFAGSALGFTYEPVTSADAPVYREYLARRYRRVSALNRAHGKAAGGAWNAFGAVELPAEAEFPDAGAPLADWIGFVSLALPIRRHAHRFTVLVPAVPGEDETESRRRLELARGVAERERPAHTSFDVRLFWALFQVGTARLGLDTTLGEGSRYTPLVLGDGTLGGGYLAPSHPWDAGERTVLGRDPLRETPS